MNLFQLTSMTPDQYEEFKRMPVAQDNALANEERRDRMFIEQREKCEKIRELAQELIDNEWAKFYINLRNEDAKTKIK